MITNLIINILGVFLIVWLVQYFFAKKKFPKQNMKYLKKDNILGERFVINRDGKENIDTNYYRYDNQKKTGLIVVCHGGSLMNGDVDLTDSFCDELRNECECAVVSINYTKLPNQKPPYQQQEIIDTVMFFMNHCEEFNLIEGNIVFVGFTGGSYLQIGAGCLLNDFGIQIKGLVSFYPLLDDSIIKLTDMNYIKYPLTVVSANNQIENQRIDTWCEHLSNANVDYDKKEYPDAMMGFIEYQFDEYMNNPMFRRNLKGYDEDQKLMSHACMMWVENQVKQYLEQ